MIDARGFRANVGIILVNQRQQLLWARRCGQNAWQFPQGGINDDESPDDAMYRELKEEVGLNAKDVEIIGRTRSWLRYRLPKKLVRYERKPVCIGQKQKWYLLRLVADESKIHFNSTSNPEFDHWRWVSYWFPLREVVPFKQQVYRRALKELASFLPE